MNTHKINKEEQARVYYVATQNVHPQRTAWLMLDYLKKNDPLLSVIIKQFIFNFKNFLYKAAIGIQWPPVPPPTKIILFI